MKRKPDRHKPLFREQPEIEERPFRDQLPHDKGEREQAAGKQKAVDQPVVVPVEAIALVEARVKESETKSGIGEPRPVEVLKETRVRLLARHPVPDAGEHERQRGAILPFDPPPRHAVRVPTLERGRDILRQLGVHRINRESIDDEALGEIAGNKPDGERDEGAGAHACEKLRGEEGGEIG